MSQQNESHPGVPVRPILSSPADLKGKKELGDHQLLRYSRHILLPEIDIRGQQNISQSRVLIVGVGGLGSAASLFLAAAGVGCLTLCDADYVDLTNLQRQIAHDTSTIGIPKVESAYKRIAAINPEIEVELINRRLYADDLGELVARASVVLDCTDNFSTRFAINRACVSSRKPLVSGAAIRFEGQLAVFDTRHPDGPCYECLFTEDDGMEETRCSEMGVLAPLVGVIGSMQAIEALKMLVPCGNATQGRLLTYDALAAEWRSLGVQRNRECSICAR